MPAALMAIVIGMALAISGAQMQTILNNPLASPFTLGISARASFGAALALACGVALIPVAGDYIVAANAFAVATATAFLIHLASIRRGASIQTIVLLGIALSALTGALIVSLSSVLAKIAVPGAVLPIGIVTAAIGLPAFLYLILKSGREIW